MINLAEISSAASDVSSHRNEVRLSQNETESLCMKAARGAGFSWGLAEEAGFATGWLAAQGIDATASLLALLMEKLGKPATSGTPRPAPGHWHSADPQPLCPITVGAALSDSALLAQSPFSRDTQFDPVAAPILLLPFLARAAQMRAQPLAIDWQRGRLLIAQSGAFDGRAADRLNDQSAVAITLRAVTGPIDFQTEPTMLPAISTAVLDGLNALALRTTVPATDTSRRGAGSASTDND